MKKFILILQFSSSLLIVKAQFNTPDSFYVVDAKNPIHDLRPVTFAFADTTRQLNFQDFASGKFDDKFK
ncbi:MAG: hypothetical protein ACR2KB_08005, partial [Chitinophagaceae bacterium]